MKFIVGHKNCVSSYQTRIVIFTASLFCVINKIYLIVNDFYFVIGDFLPEHVGIPIGEKRTSTYFMFEVHYDNPTLKQGNKNNTLTLYDLLTGP